MSAPEERKAVLLREIAKLAQEKESEALLPSEKSRYERSIARLREQVAEADREIHEGSGQGLLFGRE